jgi:predicted RecB family nuclease
MATEKKKLKICVKGHRFYKTSDCPVCPVCEAEQKPADNFLSLVGAPARRALEREGVTTLEKLSAYSEDEILQLHGMGPGTILKLRGALHTKGLSFRK